MKKILVWETLSITAGGQKVTLAVMDLLAGDCKFHCLVPDEGELSAALDARGIPYTALGDMTLPAGTKGKKAVLRYARLSVSSVFRALRVIRREKPDIIYAPGPAALPLSVICGMLARRPVVWHLHHIFIDAPTLRLLNFFAGRKRLQRIIAISDAVAEQIKSPKAKRKICLAPNPVDFEKYSSGDAQKFLAAVGIEKKDKILVGQIALLQEQKRQDVSVRAVRAMRDSGLDVKLLLAGRARDEDSGYLKSLKALVKNEGMEEHVLFLGARNDIPDMLAALDFIIVPSLEGSSLAAKEAAAAGCPVLAAGFGGAKEIIAGSGAGLCFMPDDPADAAKKAAALLENKAVFSAAGKEFAKKCTPEDYAETIRGVFGTK